MQIVILAAGYATRMYPLTEHQPKALLPVNGQPMLDHVLGRVADVSGAERVVVIINDRFVEAFERWRLKARWSGTIDLVNDGSTSDDNKLGAVGDLGLAIQQAKLDDDLLVLAGDNLFEFSVENFVRQATEWSPAHSVAVHDVGSLDAAKRYGVVDVDVSGRIQSLDEKPDAPRSSLISMGLYWLPRSKLPLVHQYLASDSSPDATGYYVRWLVEHDEVYAFRFPGRWFDIGNLEMYEEAQRAFEHKESTT